MGDRDRSGRIDFDELLDMVRGMGWEQFQRSLMNPEDAHETMPTSSLEPLGFAPDIVTRRAEELTARVADEVVTQVGDLLNRHLGIVQNIVESCVAKDVALQLDRSLGKHFAELAVHSPAKSQRGPDGHTLGVDGAQVGVLEKTNEVGLG